MVFKNGHLDPLDHHPMHTAAKTMTILKLMYLFKNSSMASPLPVSVTLSIAQSLRISALLQFRLLIMLEFSQLTMDGHIYSKILNSGIIAPNFSPFLPQAVQ